AAERRLRDEPSRGVGRVGGAAHQLDIVDEHDQQEHAGEYGDDDAEESHREIARQRQRNHRSGSARRLPELSAHAPARRATSCRSATVQPPSVLLTRWPNFPLSLDPRICPLDAPIGGARRQQARSIVSYCQFGLFWRDSPGRRLLPLSIAQARKRKPARWQYRGAQSRQPRNDAVRQHRTPARPTPRKGSSMAEPPRIVFAPFAVPATGILVVFMNGELRLGRASAKLLGRDHDLIARAASAEKFTGKLGSALDFLAPAGLQAARLLVIGSGTEAPGFGRRGGMVLRQIPPTASAPALVPGLPSGTVKPDQAEDVALGLTLRAYAFDRYKPKPREGEEKRGKHRLTLGVADAAAARKAWSRREAVQEGVVLARDLVNEPPN